MIERHLKDFINIKNIDAVINSLPKIINNPDYTFFNKISSGLEYYKKLNKNICVVVRIRFGKTLKIRSFYPVNPEKIKNRKRKELEKTVKNESI